MRVASLRLLSTFFVLTSCGCGAPSPTPTPTGGCLEPPRVFEGTCVVRSVETMDDVTTMSLDLEGPEQPPFAIVSRHPASDPSVRDVTVGQRIGCRILDRGGCPPEVFAPMPEPRGE